MCSLVFLVFFFHVSAFLFSRPYFLKFIGLSVCVNVHRFSFTMAEREREKITVFKFFKLMTLLFYLCSAWWFIFSCSPFVWWNNFINDFMFTFCEKWWTKDGIYENWILFFFSIEETTFRNNKKKKNYS